jgi:hypothetical protein
MAACGRRTGDRPGVGSPTVRRPKQVFRRAAGVSAAEGPRLRRAQRGSRRARTLREAAMPECSFINYFFIDAAELARICP